MSQTAKENEIKEQLAAGIVSTIKAEFPQLKVVWSSNYYQCVKQTNR